MSLHFRKSERSFKSDNFGISMWGYMAQIYFVQGQIEGNLLMGFEKESFQN